MTPEHERRPDGLSLEEVAKMAKETALRDGGHHPMLIVEGSQGGVAAVIEEMADTHEGRVRQMFAVGEEVGKEGQIGDLTQVFLISEGWMSAARGDERPAAPPSADPNRKEVLVITRSNANGDQTEMKVFEMLRDDKGDLTELRNFEPEPIKGTTAKSPLLDGFTAGFRVGRSGKLN